MQRRRRSVPHTFEEQIAAERDRMEAQLVGLPPGPKQEQIRRKIRQLETASHMNEWLRSPGLQAPK
jgi:hypothetical protein